jgi:hypothetical protein
MILERATTRVRPYNINIGVLIYSMGRGIKKRSIFLNDADRKERGQNNFPVPGAIQKSTQ